MINRNVIGRMQAKVPVKMEPAAAMRAQSNRPREGVEAHGRDEQWMQRTFPGDVKGEEGQGPRVGPGPGPAELRHGGAQEAPGGVKSEGPASLAAANGGGPAVAQPSGGPSSSSAGRLTAL